MNEDRENMNLKLKTNFWIFLFFFFLLPFIADTPQSGDSAEQVIVALQGGVLHPPGFPLQAWLNRFFILLPLGSPAWRLSLLSLIGHTGCVFLIFKTASKLGVSFLGSLISALAFGFYPSMSFVGMEPEVFAWAHFWISFLMFFSVKLQLDWKHPSFKSPFKDLLFLGVLFACGLGQHPITVTQFPAFIWGAYSVLVFQANQNSMKLKLTLVVSFLCCFSVLYFSMPFLRTDSPWPDWGNLENFSDVIRHGLRLEYGVFNLAVDQGSQTILGLAVLARSIAKYWNIGIILMIVGIISIFGKRLAQLRASFISILLSISLGLLLLAQSQVPVLQGARDFFWAYSTLGRFFGTVLIPLCVFMGLGFDVLILKVNRLNGGIYFAALLWIFYLMSLHSRESDPSKDHTLEIYREALTIGIYPENFYIAESDMESFYGIPSLYGRPRFPVAVGVLGLPWYVEHTVSKVEHRLKMKIPGKKAVPEILRSAVASGVEVVTTSPVIAAQAQMPFEIRGLYFVIRQGIDRNFSQTSLETAAQLCPLISQLGALDHLYNGFSQSLWPEFVRPYEGALKYLQQTQSPKKNIVSDVKTIFEGLIDGNHPSSWRMGCQNLVSDLKN